MIFNDPQYADMFKPVFGGMMIKLSEEATDAIVKNHRSAKSKQAKLFIMLTLEGDLDQNWPYEHDWNRVERRVKEAPLIYYNASRKTAARPVWTQPPGARTEWNCIWERVRLMPVARVVEKSGIPSNYRLFRN